MQEIVELEDEDEDPPNTQEVMNQLRGLMQTEDGAKDDKDETESNSNFAFESDQMTYEHSSNTNNEEVSEDAPNTYIDGLDEENANSFPSVCDENSGDVQEILESDDEAHFEELDHQFERLSDVTGTLNDAMGKKITRES